MRGNLVSISWAHQLPFSNVFIPMHIILYHLLQKRHTANSRLIVVVVVFVDYNEQICWLAYAPDIPGEWSCLWWASAVAALGSAGGCSPEGPQSLCDSLAADRPSNTDINHHGDFLKRLQPLITVTGLKTVSSATHFWLGGHQHGPHFFQFLGFSLSFLLQTCVFLFYVQAFLLV